MIALLPAPDGTGWFVITDDGMSGPPPRCSYKDCHEPSICYHRTFYGPNKVWRNKYHCTAHLPPPMEIIGGRVWISQGIE